jgi:hypothetical protein
MIVTSYPERCFLRRSSYFAAAVVSPPQPFRRRCRFAAAAEEARPAVCFGT